MNKDYSEQTIKTLSAIRDAIEHAAQTVKDEDSSYWDCVLAFGSIAVIANSGQLYVQACSEMAELSRQATLEAGDNRDAWDRAMQGIFSQDDGASIVKTYAEAAHNISRFVSTAADNVASNILKDNGVPDAVADLVSVLKDCPAEAQDVIKKTIFESLHSKDGSVEKDDEDATPKRGFTLN